MLSHVALICISQITNDVNNVSTYLFGKYVFFGKEYIPIFARFKNWAVWFLIIEFLRIFHIFWV